MQGKKGCEKGQVIITIRLNLCPFFRAYSQVIMAGSLVHWLGLAHGSGALLPQIVMSHGGWQNLLFTTRRGGPLVSQATMAIKATLFHLQLGKIIGEKNQDKIIIIGVYYNLVLYFQKMYTVQCICKMVYTASRGPGSDGGLIGSAPGKKSDSSRLELLLQT